MSVSSTGCSHLSPVHWLLPTGPSLLSCYRVRAMERSLSCALFSTHPPPVPSRRFMFKIMQLEHVTCDQSARVDLQKEG